MKRWIVVLAMMTTCAAGVFCVPTKPKSDDLHTVKAEVGVWFREYEEYTRQIIAGRTPDPAYEEELSARIKVLNRRYEAARK